MLNKTDKRLVRMVVVELLYDSISYPIATHRLHPNLCFVNIDNMLHGIKHRYQIYYARIVSGH